MAKHPNQFTITVESSSGKRKVDKPYGVITEKELVAAFHVLGQYNTAVALFIALAVNKDGYVFDFSPQALQNKYGISVKRWTEARKALEKHGYLVPDGKHRFKFYSLPPHLRNVTFLSADQSPADGGIEALQSPADGGIIPHERGYNPPQTEVSSPVDGGSNNKTIQNNINNTDLEIPKENNLSGSADSVSVLENDQSALGTERDAFLDAIKESFGEWDGIDMEIMAAESKSKRHGRTGRAALVALIDELKKLYQRLNERRSFNMHDFKREYRAAINKTMPRDDRDYMRVWLILNKFEQEYKDAHNGRGWPWTWGVWVNGWNEELQEPNFTVSMFALPPSVIAKQRHNLEGIPKEYYKTLGKKE